MTQLRKHRVVIYNLKRLYGQKATFFTLTRNDHNVLTGEITREYDETVIQYAIVLPATLDRSSVYDLAYIASAKNFTGGAFFDRNNRVVVLDASDLPVGFKPTLQTHLQFDNERFEIKSIQVVAQRAIYMLAVQSLSNSELS